MCSLGRVFPEPIQTQHFSLDVLAESDFDALYAVAADPLIWAVSYTHLTLPTILLV